MRIRARTDAVTGDFCENEDVSGANRDANTSPHTKENFTVTTREAQNKAIHRRYFAASDAADLAAFDELMAPDFVNHYPGAPGPLNREATLQMGTMFWAAFSDHYYTIEDQIAEGDKVATRLAWRAIHSGDFQGLPPTGRKVAVSGIAVAHIKDGIILEHWATFDQMGMMQQLGLVPPPQPAR